MNFEWLFLKQLVCVVSAQCALNTEIVGANLLT